MKRFGTYIFILTLILSLGFFSSCKKKTEATPVPTTADINVSLVPLQGETVDVSVLSVELHKNAFYTDMAYSAAASGSATASTAKFNKIPPGTYYLMAWKDKDNDGDFSDGDIFGFLTKPLKAEKGKKYNFTLEMYELNETIY